MMDFLVNSGYGLLFKILDAGAALASFLGFRIEKPRLS
jgi:hypothetical protein